ncbi:IS630 family transposase [Orientia tsutsugamushi]|nr:IS630 family transposase [Orientia tsutsugamushi]
MMLLSLFSMLKNFIVNDYSPDLNPIEYYWFKIKNEISKVTAQFKDISMAVEHVMKFI